PSLGLDEMKLELYDLRDGLVFPDELGMRPQEQLAGAPGHRTQQQHGRRDDRRDRGRHPQARHGHPREPRREEPELDEERLEMRGGAEEPEEVTVPEDRDQPREDHEERREADASQTPSAARSHSGDRDVDREEEPEPESSVVDPDDAPE